VDKTTKTVLILIMALAAALLAFCLFMAVGCGCPKIARYSYTQYSIDKRECIRTPEGACILTNGNIISDAWLEEVDKKITETEKCIGIWKKTKPDILHRDPSWKPPKRSCYTILLPGDWDVACSDSRQQVFGRAGNGSCLGKGLPPTEECPCAWRVVLQDGNVIVTTPNLYMLRPGVVELLTGYDSRNLWNTPELIKCSGF